MPNKFGMLDSISKSSKISNSQLLQKVLLHLNRGGSPDTPTYFSYQARQNDKLIPSIQISRFYLENLAPELLPPGCSIFDNRGLGTNMIAEYCAVYYGVLRFKKFYDWSRVIVYHDSEVIVKHMSGEYQCKKDHLRCWLSALKSIWWGTIEYQWVPRKEIVEILGH